MKKSFFKILSVAAVAVTLTSCLKDKKVEDKVYGTNGIEEIKIVEIPGPLNDATVINLEFATVDTTFALVTLNLATDQVASEDVVVNLTQVPSLVADYNNVHGTTYTAMPTSLYSLDPLKVTIKKGSRFGYLKVKGKPSDFATGTYAWGFSIANIETGGYTISGNFRNTVVIVGVKNKYDAVYSLKGKNVGWTAYGISDAAYTWPGDVFLITSGVNSVDLFDDWGFGTYIQPAITPTAYTGFGQTKPRFIFNTTTNAMTNCINGQATTNGRTFEMNPAYTTSRYDPVAKVVYAAVLLKQSNPARPDLQVFDTLTYVRPR
jgi:hypothetical protein